jgi:hypothetical protein
MTLPAAAKGNNEPISQFSTSIKMHEASSAQQKIHNGMVLLAGMH